MIKSAPLRARLIHAVVHQQTEEMFRAELWSCLLGVKQASIVDAFSKPKPSSTSAKRVPSFDSSDSEAEVKAPAKKPVSKRKQVDSDDSDSDSDNLMSRLKAKSTGSKVSCDLGAGVICEASL